MLKGPEKNLNSLPTREAEEGERGSEKGEAESIREKREREGESERERETESRRGRWIERVSREYC